ncbi:MAG: M48 family metallopeptidase [Prevotella sp.]|nr:M48 family metallopeptidase [Prevotella sp.]
MRAIKGLLLSLLAAVLVGCGTTKTVPITGRQQNLLVTDGEMLSLSTQQYSEYMKTAKPSTNAANTAMVKRVGQRLATAVETYLKNNGMAEDVQNYKWQFNLVQDQNVNAWCMPGGLICVYEGLLPVTQDEASLAIVMGHEIAHAVARHSAEQYSTQVKQQYGLQAGTVLASVLGAGSNTIAAGQTILSQGLGLQNLHYSRNHESEADHLGIIFAAMAGYDPQVAVNFWQRMAAQSSNKTSEFLSSHPSDATRIKQIQGWMPEALKYYKGQTTSSGASSKSSSSSTPKTTKTIHISSKKKK